MGKKESKKRKPNQSTVQRNKTKKAIKQGENFDYFRLA